MKGIEIGRENSILIELAANECDAPCAATTKKRESIDDMIDAHVWIRRRESRLDRRPLPHDSVPDELLTESRPSYKAQGSRKQRSGCSCVHPRAAPIIREGDGIMSCSTMPEWILALCTLVLAFIAIFPATVHGWIYHPKFTVETRTGPPECVGVPISDLGGNFITDCVFLRVWIKNDGSEAAKNVEVYAEKLQRRRADGSWEPVPRFPPMNLKWANANGAIFYPIISPTMGKHCDVAHIVDPTNRRHPNLTEYNQALKLAADQTSLAFDLQTAPNHRGHIVEPGIYRLGIIVAAENASPVRRTIEITVDGRWDADADRMLRDYVGIKVLSG